MISRLIVKVSSAASGATCSRAFMFLVQVHYDEANGLSEACSKSILLSPQGIGKTLAQWQPRYAIHAGMYLYILEGEASRTYMHYSSLFGKQVVNVLPSSVGGWEHVFAICDRGADLSKVRT